jgi:hypothetical protein
MNANETRQHLLRLALSIKRDEGMRGLLSTAEHLAVALLLNRHDWLDEMSFTMAEAFDRLSAQWVAQLRRVERELQETPPEGEREALT